MDACVGALAGESVCVCVRACVCWAWGRVGVYPQRPSSVRQTEESGRWEGGPGMCQPDAWCFHSLLQAPPGPSSARSRVGWLENRFPSSPASGGRVGRPGSPASPREGRSFPEEASRTERRHRLVNAGPRSGWCVNRIAVNHVASESYRHRAVDSLVKGKPLCWENTPPPFISLLISGGRHLFQLSSEFLSSVLFLDDLFCPCNPPLPTYWNG